MDLEKIATSSVAMSISATDVLSPFINEGDKEPSWDGNVYIYSNKDKKKEGIKKVPVKVKGKQKDDFSKETYANILLFRMKKAQQNFALVQRDHQYFALPEFMKDLYYQEVFVDCGAFIGDTIENYLKERGGVFQKIYAFEPNNSIYEALSVHQSGSGADGQIVVLGDSHGDQDCRWVHGREALVYQMIYKGKVK